MIVGRGLIILICAIPAFGQVGSVAGQALDPTGAPLPNATVRMMLPEGRTTVYGSGSGRDGRFRFENIRRGRYTLAISVPGFRERFIRDVIVEGAVEADVGSVRLEFAGCDAPGVFCDSFSTAPAMPMPLSSGDLKLFLACSVDLESGEVACTVVLDGPPATSPPGDRNADLGVQTIDDKKIYFAPRNRAELSEPDTDDCRGALARDRIRVDGLGVGSDLCVRTRNGHLSHVFFTAEVQSERPITIHYVTYR